MEPKIKIILADQKIIIRDSLKNFFSKDPRFELIGEVKSVRELLDLLKNTKPNAVILDPEMKEVSGTEALKTIRQRFPDTKVIIFSAKHDKETVLEYFSLGIRSYLNHESDPLEISDTILNLQTNNYYFTKEVTNFILEEYYYSISGSTNKVKLSPREQEAVGVLRKEKSAKDAAVKLNISVDGVNALKRTIFKKTDSHSLREALEKTK